MVQNGAKLRKADMTLTQDFLDKYTEFETFIKNRNNVGKFEKSDILNDKVLKRNRNLWEFYRNLRNLLTHEPDVRNGNYVILTQKLYDDFSRDVDRIMHPKTALNIAVKESSIYKVKQGEIISNVIETMLEKNYTCTPIVDNTEKLIGVFSSHSLMLYFNKYKDGIVEEPQKATIADLIEFCSLDENKEIEYKFVAKTCDEYYIKDLFKKSLVDKKRLEALFVTENGHSSEKLLGIITHWDLDK